MKKIIKLSSSLALIFLLGLSLSSYDSATVVNDNGVDVEVVKGGDYWIVACDGQLIYRDKNTQQYKNGILHMRTTVYRLPEGCSSIPDKATKVRPYPGYSLNYSPSGIVVVKEIYN